MELEARFERLERKCRRLWLALVACFAVGLVLLAGLGALDTTITADRIVLPGNKLTFATSAGRELASLEQRQGVASFRMLSEAGKADAHLFCLATGGGYLTLRGKKDPVVALGSSHDSSRGFVIVYGARTADTPPIRAGATLSRDENGGLVRLFSNHFELRGKLAIEDDGLVHLRSFSGNAGKETPDAEWPER